MRPLCVLRASFQIRAVLLLLLLLLLLLQQQHNGCWCFQYQVGDLNCWGLPPPSSPLVYSSWSQNHHFRPGDSLLFLYPPSQDSVIQVTEKAFNSCSVEDPILRLEDGNSRFNLNAPGYFYFTSGVAGHCEKNQKLVVAVPSANGTFFPPAADVATPPGGAPSFPIVFGPASAPGSDAPPAGAFAAVGTTAAAAMLLGFALV